MRLSVCGYIFYYPLNGGIIVKVGLISLLYTSFGVSAWTVTFLEC